MLGASLITSFFNASENQSKKSNSTSIDIVLYALNLASNPDLMAPHRESLREISAKVPPGEKDYSQEIQSSLKSLYLEIEKKLLEKEQIKQITKDELRKTISEKFKLDKDEEKTFWHNL